MAVVYIDEAFLLNTLVDYLLLLSAARLAGESLHRGRMILAALLGGLYAAAAFLPGCEFLTYPLCKPALGVAMTLMAFGSSRHLLRVSLVFFGVSAAFGGGVLALQLFFGAPAVLDVKTVLLSAAGCWVFLTVVFRRTAQHGNRELVPVSLELDGRTVRLVALRDTGNTLTDPHTGRGVLVCEGEKAAALFPKGAYPTSEELENPVEAMKARGGDTRWRLLPYRAVGVSHALLLCVRVDRALVDGENIGSILVALSPTPVSDGGGYNALIGA